MRRVLITKVEARDALGAEDHHPRDRFFPVHARAFNSGSFLQAASQNDHRHIPPLTLHNADNDSHAPALDTMDMVRLRRVAYRTQHRR